MKCLRALVDLFHFAFRASVKFHNDRRSLFHIRRVFHFTIRPFCCIISSINKNLTKEWLYAEHWKPYFGACAWLFAGLAIATPKAYTSHRNTLVSFGLCAISRVFQLFEINRRVFLGDYAAIEDTIRAVLIASVALVSITMILNLVALAKAKNK